MSAALSELHRRLAPAVPFLLMLGLVLLALGPASAGSALAAEEAEDEPPPPIELPEFLAAQLELLSEEELAFLKSPATRRFAGDTDELIDTLSKRDAMEVRAYVQAMMSVTEQRGYVEGRDAGTIPLNTDSPSFNAWRLIRPRSLDPQREPGPVELGRYSGGRGGPPTFGGAPMALTPEDLVAGEVDVAIVGAPLNMGSGWRDSERSTVELRVLGRPIGSQDQYVQITASDVLNIVDYGDIAVDNASTERSMQHARDIVREIAETGAVPVIIGGDHSLEYPNVAGLADVYGKENVGVIHFDSHYDAWWGGAHLINHGYPVYRLIKEGHVLGSNYIQVGLRSSGPDKEGFRWMREQGMRYHTMAEVERRGWPAVMERAIAEAREGGKKLHISFDIDVLDPAFMVGTGTPVPGGLNMREAITIVRRLCAESDVVGFDLVELHPALDPTYRSTINSAHIVKACLTGLAMRREGLDAEHYLSPLSAEHVVDDYYGDRELYLEPEEDGEGDAEDD